jgi:hypothetical protein
VPVCPCPCLIKPKTKSVKFNLNPSALSLAKLITRLQRVLRRVKPHNNTISWGEIPNQLQSDTTLKNSFPLSARAHCVELCFWPLTHTHIQTAGNYYCCWQSQKHTFQPTSLGGGGSSARGASTHDWWSSENYVMANGGYCIWFSFHAYIRRCAHLWARQREWVCFVGI